MSAHEDKKMKYDEDEFLAGGLGVLFSGGNKSAVKDRLSSISGVDIPSSPIIDLSSGGTSTCCSPDLRESPAGEETRCSAAYKTDIVNTVVGESISPVSSHIGNKLERPIGIPKFPVCGYIGDKDETGEQMRNYIMETRDNNIPGCNNPNWMGRILPKYAIRGSGNSCNPRIGLEPRMGPWSRMCNSNIGFNLAPRPLLNKTLDISSEDMGEMAWQGESPRPWDSMDNNKECQLQGGNYDGFEMARGNFIDKNHGLNYSIDEHCIGMNQSPGDSQHIRSYANEFQNLHGTITSKYVPNNSRIDGYQRHYVCDNYDARLLYNNRDDYRSARGINYPGYQGSGSYINSQGVRYPNTSNTGYQEYKNLQNDTDPTVMGRYLSGIGQYSGPRLTDVKRMDNEDYQSKIRRATLIGLERNAIQRPLRLTPKEMIEGYKKGCLCLSCDSLDHKISRCPNSTFVCPNCHRASHRGEECQQACRFCGKYHPLVSVFDCIKEATRQNRLLEMSLEDPNCGTDYVIRNSSVYTNRCTPSSRRSNTGGTMEFVDLSTRPNNKYGRSIWVAGIPREMTDDQLRRFIAGHTTKGNVEDVFRRQNCEWAFLALSSLEAAGDLVQKTIYCNGKQLKIQFRKSEAGSIALGNTKPIVYDSSRSSIELDASQDLCFDHQAQRDANGDIGKIPYRPENQLGMDQNRNWDKEICQGTNCNNMAGQKEILSAHGMTKLQERPISHIHQTSESFKAEMNDNDKNVYGNIQNDIPIYKHYKNMIQEECQKCLHYFISGQSFVDSEIVQKVESYFGIQQTEAGFFCNLTRFMEGKLNTEHFIRELSTIFLAKANGNALREAVQKAGQNVLSQINQYNFNKSHIQINDNNANQSNVIHANDNPELISANESTLKTLTARNQMTDTVVFHNPGQHSMNQHPIEHHNARQYQQIPRTDDHKVNTMNQSRVSYQNPGFEFQNNQNITAPTLVTTGQSKSDIIEINVNLEQLDIGDLDASQVQKRKKNPNEKKKKKSLPNLESNVTPKNIILKNSFDQYNELMHPPTSTLESLTTTMESTVVVVESNPVQSQDPINKNHISDMHTDGNNIQMNSNLSSETSTIRGTKKHVNDNQTYSVSQQENVSNSDDNQIHIPMVPNQENNNNVSQIFIQNTQTNKEIIPNEIKDTFKLSEWQDARMNDFTTSLPIDAISGAVENIKIPHN